MTGRMKKMSEEMPQKIPEKMPKELAEIIYGGSYRLKYLLGRGTTAQVYLAEDIHTGERFAAKVSADCHMLRQEEQILKRVGPQVFPQAKGYFEQDVDGEWTGLLLMEYLEGGTLQHAIDIHGCFKVPEAVRIVQEILECLHVLHEQPEPLIYRDVKPENIMFDREGRVRLIDAASAIRGKYRMGTYGYAAPEQFWEGAKPGPACDLYAAGKVLAYLLTGKNPGEPPYDMLDYCSRDIRVPVPLLRVLERSLALEEMGRYESAEGFSKDLEKALCRCLKRTGCFRQNKQKIIYEKCIHKSGIQKK